jgi:hypothetical protein
MNDMTASWPILHADQFHLLYWVEQLRTLPTITLVLALVGGILCLLYGRSLFRMIIILNAMILAGWLGWTLGGQINHPLLCGVGLAVIFGLLAWPMFKLGIAVFFGLIGIGLLAWLASLFPIGQQYWPIVAAAGFLVFALLGWFLLMPAVILFTALEGAGLSILTLLVLGERLKLPLDKIPHIALDRPSLVHLAVLILAVLGIFHQMGLAEGKGQKENDSAQQKNAE